MYLFGSLGVLLVVVVRTHDILAGAINFGDCRRISYIFRFLQNRSANCIAKPVDQAGRAAAERVFEESDEPAESQRGREFKRERCGRD